MIRRSGLGPRVRPILLALFLAFGCAAPARDPVARPLRIAVRAVSAVGLSTLSYRGGFETKTLIYETLVARDAEGRIAPALAQSWRYENGGTECVLELRDDARFHDGTEVTAEAVRQHFRRWVGLPEHDWLPCNQRIRRVVAEDRRVLRIVMDRPHALLPELCAINPCGIRAPSTLDSEGNFVKPVGSGSFRWEGEDGRVAHYSSSRSAGEERSRIDLVRFSDEDADEIVDELLAGLLDVVCDSWNLRIPRERLEALRADRRVRVIDSAGSSVVSLGFRTERGPCADVALRRRIRDALDRELLIENVESGCADACFQLVAPSIRSWPESTTARETHAMSSNERSRPVLRLLARADDERDSALAREIALQLERANIATKVVLQGGEALSAATMEGAFEMRIEKSWGVPYDPDLALSARFGPPLDHPSAAHPPTWGRDPLLAELVVEARAEWDEARRARVFARIQERVDETATLIPLYVPRRYAVLRADLPVLRLDHDLYRIDAAGMLDGAFAGQR